MLHGVGRCTVGGAPDQARSGHVSPQLYTVRARTPAVQLLSSHTHTHTHLRLPAPSFGKLAISIASWILSFLSGLRPACDHVRRQGADTVHRAALRNENRQRRARAPRGLPGPIPTNRPPPQRALAPRTPTHASWRREQRANARPAHHGWVGWCGGGHGSLDGGRAAGRTERAHGKRHLVDVNVAVVVTVLHIHQVEAVAHPLPVELCRARRGGPCDGLAGVAAEGAGRGQSETGRRKDGGWVGGWVARR